MRALESKKQSTQLAIPSLSDEVVRHRSGNFRKPPPDLVEAGCGSSVAQLRSEAFEEFDIEGRTRRGRDLRDAHNHVFMFCQIQWLQGLEHAILVHGFDLHGHAPLYASSGAAGHVWLDHRSGGYVAHLPQ